MKAYGFKNGHLFINGVEMTHFAADDAVKWKYRENRATSKVGADGRMAVAFNADESGELTIKFHQTSPSQKVLQDLVVLQNGGPNSFMPIAWLWQDTYRQDVAEGAFGYIESVGETSRGKEIAEQEFVLVTEKMNQAFGDPAFVAGLTALAEIAV